MHSIIYDLLKKIIYNYCEDTNQSYLKSEFPRFMEWFYFKYVNTNKGD